jgi:uncharacterized membrane protein YiaA
MRARLLVLLGMTAALIFVAGAFIGALDLIRPHLALPEDGDAAGRILFVLGWLPLAAVWLMLMVGSISTTRFFHRESITGAATAAIEIDQRVLRNTIEQLLLLAIGLMGLAALGPAEALAAVPVLVALFGLGRLAFWIGYRIHPLARAFGFATTFYPTVGLYIYLALAAADRLGINP